MTTQSLNYQTKRLQCTFKNSAGTPVNPNEITLKVYREWQGVTTEVLSKAKADLSTSGTGIFYYDFTPGANGAGRYIARFTTDSGVDVEQDWQVSSGATA